MRTTYAGMNVIVIRNASSTPSATNAPNTWTGGIGVSSSDANPIAVVTDVNSIGV